MASPGKIRLLIVDDHPLMRLGLRTRISSDSDMEVVAEAENGPGAVAAFAEHAPDVVLLDLRLPGMTGPEVITAMRQRDPDAKILVFTSYYADEDIYRAIEAGARGYVLKGTFGEGIVEAIRSVHAGRRVIAPELTARLAERNGSASLSPRELEVLELVLKGLTNREVGAVLFVTEATIKFHLKNIYAKLGVDDRTEAAFVALQRGIITVE